MNFFIPVGEHGPTIVILIVLAIFGTMILREKRRRRRRAAAGLPIFGPAERPEGAEGSGPVQQSLTLSREVVEHFRATGPGWQARIDEVLKRHVTMVGEMRRSVAEALQAEPRVAEEQEGFRGQEGEG